MTPLRGHLSRFLRWDKVAVALMLGLPTVALIPLGIWWLIEHELILHYGILFGGIATVTWAITRLVRWSVRRRGDADGEAALARHDTDLPPEPDWSAADTAAYEAARRMIRSRTHRALPGEEMSDLLREVLTTVARSYGQDRDIYDFTLPEALLLTSEVTDRLRGDLRDLVPFSDTIRIRTLLWFYHRRERIGVATETLTTAWRVLRMARNPPLAVAQEIERLMSSGYSGYLNTEFVATAQTILLEEVARAAVELYSGRLRFSDSELLDIRMADGAFDRARAARPDAPLRIAVAGQISAGKSTLINALLRQEAAETDMATVTDRATAYPVRIGGIDCTLVDLPGLDGSAGVQAATLAELDRADLIVWVLRAGRPARAPDAAALTAMRARRAAAPGRRHAPVVPVLSAIDTLIPGWPLPELRIPADTSRRIADALTGIAQELALDRVPIPVCAVTPDWNVDTLLATLTADQGEALMVQRSRARQVRGGRDIGGQVRRGARGLVRGSRAWWDRSADRG